MLLSSWPEHFFQAESDIFTLMILVEVRMGLILNSTDGVAGMTSTIKPL